MSSNLSRKSPIVAMKLTGSPSCFMDVEKRFPPPRTTGFFRVAVDTLLQGVAGGNPVAHAAQLLALVRPHCDVRGSFGHEEQDGK